MHSIDHALSCVIMLCMVGCSGVHKQCSVEDIPARDSAIATKQVKSRQHFNVRLHSYPSGQLMLQSFYHTDDISSLYRTIWYSPEGEVLFRTDWKPGEHGLMFYLHDNGTVRMLVSGKEGVFDGIGVSYTSSGEAEQVAQYEHGKLVAVLWKSDKLSNNAPTTPLSDWNEIIELLESD